MDSNSCVVLLQTRAQGASVRPLSCCLLCGARPLKAVVLGGAYVGSYPAYLLRVEVPALGFDKAVPVVGVPSPPAAFDGIACFRFLNRFTYGNFGVDSQFALEA